MAPYGSPRVGLVIMSESRSGRRGRQSVERTARQARPAEAAALYGPGDGSNGREAEARRLQTVGTESKLKLSLPPREI